VWRLTTNKTLTRLWRVLFTLSMADGANYTLYASLVHQRSAGRSMRAGKFRAVQEYSASLRETDEKILSRATASLLPPALYEFLDNAIKIPPVARMSTSTLEIRKGGVVHHLPLRGLGISTEH